MFCEAYLWCISWFCYELNILIMITQCYSAVMKWHNIQFCVYNAKWFYLMTHIVSTKSEMSHQCQANGTNCLTVILGKINPSNGWLWMNVSYTLSREYRMVRNRYSRLLFTSEDRLWANLHVQEQLTNMTSQCQCLAFAWRHRSTVMTSQCQGKKTPSLATMAKWAIDHCLQRNGICSRYKIACKK